MLSLTSLDILYIVLSIFTAIIGTLLSIVLFKVIKILNPLLEIVGYYNKFKEYISSYKAIPNIVKEKINELIGNYSKKKTQKKPKTKK